MRVLFSTPAGLGHFLPIVPLAWAARAGGHAVRVVTGAAAVQAAVRAGLPSVDICQDRDRVGALDEGPTAFAAIARQSVRLEEPVVERAIHAITSWHPDLIVHTLGDFVGPVAAAMHPIPLVLHGLGVPPIGRSGMPPPPDVRSVLRRLGLEATLPEAAAVVDTCPPSLREPDRPAARPMRYVPYNGGGRLPDWLLRPTSMLRLCVTLGTVLPVVAGAGPFRPIVDAVDGLDVEVVVLLGNVDRTELGTVPDNVLCADWLPLSELLPTCSAIVHHGGAGTTMSAVVAGVPQLVLDYRDATALTNRGIGLTLPVDGLEPASVRSGIQRLLQEPEFGRAAHEVSLENAMLPRPSTVMNDLCRLVAESSPQGR